MVSHCKTDQFLSGSVFNRISKDLDAIEIALILILFLIMFLISTINFIITSFAKWAKCKVYQLIVPS